MGAILCALAIVLTFFLGLLFRVRTATVAYLILAFTCPNLFVAGHIVPYEIAAFPVVLFVFSLTRSCLKMPIGHYIADTAYLYLLVYMFLLVFSTVVSVTTGTGRFIGAVPVAGVLRMLIVVLLLAHLLETRHFDLVLLAVLAINSVVVVFQFLEPTSVPLFHQFYFKESLTPLGSFLKRGYFTRFPGTFGTPTDLAILSLLSFSWFFGQTLSKRPTKKMLAGIVMSILCGIVTVSKTSLFGIPLMFAFGVLFFSGRSWLVSATNPRYRINLHHFIIRSAIVVFAVVFVVGMFLYVAERSPELRRYFSFLDDYQKIVARVFETRLGSESREGALLDTWRVFLQNPVMGIGFTKAGDEFTGDSMYMNILHNSGVMGAILFLFFFFTVMRGMLASRDYPGLFFTAAFLLSGLTTPVHVSLFGTVVLGYACTTHLRYGSRERVSEISQNADACQGIVV